MDQFFARRPYLEILKKTSMNWLVGLLHFILVIIYKSFFVCVKIKLYLSILLLAVAKNDEDAVRGLIEKGVRELHSLIFICD